MLFWSNILLPSSGMKNKQSKRGLLPAFLFSGFLFGLLRNPKDGCSKVVRNVCGFLPDSVALSPRWLSSYFTYNNSDDMTIDKFCASQDLLQMHRLVLNSKSILINLSKWFQQFRSYGILSAKVYLFHELQKMTGTQVPNYENQLEFV
jgi:hypothetical protein